jgi:hypothetical protein
MIGAAAGLFAAVAFTGGAASVLATPLMSHLIVGLALGGAAMEAGAIATALTSNRGMNITTRQAAAFRQVIYGEQRVGGGVIYQSTTGGSLAQYNYVIVFTNHVIDSMVNLYLDGRQVFFTGSGPGNYTRNGVNFGGNANGNTYTGPNGNYNFGGMVYCAPYFGDQTDADGTVPGGGFDTGLQANDPTWSPSAQGIPYVAGCSYMYLKVEYNPTMIPSPPEVRVTIRGKNDIYDPRTGTRGYSNNAALCVADIYSSTAFLLNEAVNEAQLIAAANVCDEAIDLAAGGTEPQFCCNYHFDTGTAAGDVIPEMLKSMAGRVSRIGGEIYLFPAYWQGASFTFDLGSLAANFTWNPKRHPRDLCNYVTGTYIAPTYPYNATAANGSNLYDANGFYNGAIQNNFPYAFVPTNYPQYAEDTNHGYSSNEWLNEDSGVSGTYSSGTTYALSQVVISSGLIYKSLVAGNVGHTPVGGDDDTYWEFGAVLLPKELTQAAVLSVSQAQRLAKIELERNRLQGTSIFTMFPVAYRMQPMDVMQFTAPALGWVEKTLEIGPMKPLFAPDKNGIPCFAVGVSVNETAASVYEWSTAEEQTVYAAPATPPSMSYVPVPPTGLTAISLPLIGLDNVVTPRVELTWTPPADGFVQQIQIQQRLDDPGTTAGAWMDAGTVSVVLTSAFVAGLIAGQTYDFQIRSVRANGSVSPWVGLNGFTVGITVSQLTNLGVGVGSLIAESFSGGVAEILCNPFTARIGQFNVSVLPAGAYTLTVSTTPAAVTTALAQGELYYVYYRDPNFTGGAITPIATQNPSDFEDQVGVFLIDSIVTQALSMSGGMVYQPMTSNPVGGRTTTNQDGPCAGGSGDATVSSTANAQNIGFPVRRAIGACTWSGFPAMTFTSAKTLTVPASVEIDIAGPGGTGTGEATLTATIGSATSTLLDVTATTGEIGYTLNIPAGTDISTVSVTASPTADATSNSGDSATCSMGVGAITIA